MKQSLYETLGVSQDATAEELKAAYREAAKKSHPDVGGTVEKFAEVSYAYRILKDPGSRLLYDKTGQPEQKRIEVEVRDTLLVAFQTALKAEQGTILENVKKFLEEGKKRMREQRLKLTLIETKLNTKRNLIETKEGHQNLLHIIIDHDLQEVKSSLAQVKRQFEIIDACYKELENYNSLEPISDPTKRGGPFKHMVVMNSTMDPRDVFHFNQMFVDQAKRMREYQERKEQEDE